MTTKTKKRFQTLKNIKGVRKDLVTGKYVATKYVNGKRQSKTFICLPTAKKWKNLISAPKLISNNQIQENEKDLLLSKIVFSNVFEDYKKFYLVTLEQSSIETKLLRCRFLDLLMSVPIDEITPQYLDQYIILKKEQESLVPNSRKYDFVLPLKELKAILNWYIENRDYKFVNPVLKRHFKQSQIRPREERNKKMSTEEVLKFFNALDPFFKDFAMTQFYVAGRVGEIAGLQIESIDFKNKSLKIQDIVVWDSHKNFLKLKSKPKNGEIRFCYLNDVLVDIFKRNLKTGLSENYVFSLDGGPLKYRQIQFQYNKALKKCGLYGKYSSTHILRHTMATITRTVTGSLQATQAVTGPGQSHLII